MIYIYIYAEMVATTTEVHCTPFPIPFPSKDRQDRLGGRGELLTLGVVELIGVLYGRELGSKKRNAASPV